jgi:hypothetical protein
VTGEATIQIHLDELSRQLGEVLVQHIDLSVKVDGNGGGVHRQQVAPLIFQPRHPVAAVEDSHALLALLNIARELTLVVLRIDEGAGELRLCGVSEVDGVALAVAQDIDDEALHGFGVIVGEVDSRDVAVLVGLVADDAVTIRNGLGGVGKRAKA